MRLTGGRQVETESARATKAMKRTEAAAKANSAASVAAAGTSSTAFRKQAAMMQATGRRMTMGITAPLGLVGVMAVKTAANFDKSMAQVQTATNLGGRGMKEMEALALKWGAETIFSANESAEAMLELTKAGIDPAQVKAGALGATMNLAATEGLALGRTAEIVGGAMNTFGIKATESERIADALAGGALASSASVEGLAQSLSQGGQSAAMYGLSVEEAVGGLSAFAQNGIQASDAGTSFKTFLMRLNPTTKKAKELMAELGLDFFDSRGHMLSLADTSKMLNEKLGDMSDEQRGAAFNVLFGSDAIRAANIVYKEGPAGIEKYVRATEKKGSADKMAQAQMQGLNGALEQLKGSFETAAVHLGHALAPAVEMTATAVGGLADQFSALPPEVQTTIAVVGTLAALAGPVLWFAGSMAKAVIAIRELRAAEAFGGGGLMGGRGKFMGRLGIAGAGIAASQIGGDAVGGDLGGWLSATGTGAAAGFAVGGPLGAAVGAAGGGVFAAVQKLTGAERQLTGQQMRLADSSEELGDAMKRQRSAAGGLLAADRRVSVAQRQRRSAVQEARSAQRHYNAVVNEYGARSRPAIHAEARLVQLTNQRRQAIKRLENAEKLRGVALQAYKTQTNVTILAERHRINVLTALRDRQSRLFQAARAANPQSERTQRLAQNLLGTEGKLAEAHRKQGQTLAEAASKGGKKYATFLQRANQESLRFGGSLKALDMKVSGLTENLERLAEAPTAPRPANPFGNHLPGKLRGGGRGVSNPDVTPAPATLRLRGPVPDPQPSGRLSQIGGAGGGTRFMQPLVLQIGKRVLTEAVYETKEDAEARL
jgi:TP901 family phage tail tape measure protein